MGFAKDVCIKAVLNQIVISILLKQFHFSNLYNFDLHTLMVGCRLK